MSSIRPNSLMNLSSSLTTLSLRECDLRGKLENNILCLPSIQTLDLASNSNLEGSLPKSNWSSSSLKFLDLSFMSFSGEFLDFIDNMKSLEHLNLAGCNLTGLISTSFDNLTKLTTLDLSSNSFSSEGELPNFIKNMKSLEDLNLANCNLTGSISTSLGNLTRLTILDLSYNSFSGEFQFQLLNFSCLWHTHELTIFF